MKILIAVLVLTALALLGSRLIRQPSRLPFAVSTLFTGGEYLVVGLLLGSQFLDLIDWTALERLRPIVAVLLGWVGFLFGLQFDRRTLSNLPRGFLGISAAQAAITIVCLTPVLWYLMAPRLGEFDSNTVLSVVMLAAAGACTGHAGLVFLARRESAASRHVVTLLRFISSLDPVVSLLLFGSTISLISTHPFGVEGFPWQMQWLVVSICLGLLTAWVFVSLTLTRTSQPELVLYLLGTIALASGVALALGLSVLLVSFVCGIAFANLANVRSIRARVMNLMTRGERFLYLLLLIIAGAFWQLPSAWVLVVTAVYVVARAIGKTLGGYVATLGLAQQHPSTPAIGLGLISQGGMAIAIVVEYRFLADQAENASVVSIALLSILVNGLVAPWLSRHLVNRAEENER